MEPNKLMEQFILNHLWLLPVFILVVVWSLVWKGLALWRAARAGHWRWFIALLVVNTMGLLEILYIYIFSRKTAPAPDGAEV